MQALQRFGRKSIVKSTTNIQKAEAEIRGKEAQILYDIKQKHETVSIRAKVLAYMCCY